MSLEKATKEKFPETGQTKTFPLDSKAMAQYALGSSKLIASLLIIPDAFALVPNSVNFIGWALKLVGLWVSAAVLWFVSFNGILQLVKFLTDGVRINDEGIYPWRLARLIRWHDIEAVAIEERAVFSRIFFLTPKAKRVTLFVDKGKENRLVPNYLPSFLFAKESFEEIIRLITLKKFGITPSSDECIFATEIGAKKMTPTNKLLQWQRFLVSSLVAVSLTMFLGRKAFVNYSYNSGNKAFANHGYLQASALYQRAVGIDPAFAFAWEALARSNLAMGHAREAKDQWTRALFLKPDYVEAQLGLARLALRAGQLRNAKFLIDAALNLAPQNKQALLTLAMYKWHAGQFNDAQKLARKLTFAQVTKHPALDLSRRDDEDEVALCLLACVDAKNGDLTEAHQILKSLSGNIHAQNVDLLYTEAEIRALMEEAKDSEAKSFLKVALAEHPDDVPLNTLRLKIALKERDLDTAKECLTKLKSNGNEEIETPLSEAKFLLLTGDKAHCQNILDALSERKDITPTSLKEISAFLERIGAHQSAVNAAARAVLIDHDNSPANSPSY